MPLLAEENYGDKLDTWIPQHIELAAPSVVLKNELHFLFIP